LSKINSFRPQNPGGTGIEIPWRGVSGRACPRPIVQRMSCSLARVLWPTFFDDHENARPYTRFFSPETRLHEHSRLEAGRPFVWLYFVKMLVALLNLKCFQFSDGCFYLPHAFGRQKTKRKPGEAFLLTNRSNNL